MSCGSALCAIAGLFDAATTGMLAAFLEGLVCGAIIAGLALLGTPGSVLATALKDAAALIAFLATLSGVASAGVGFAFWGTVAGSMALVVQQYVRRTAARPE